jgi:hypothetical protein
MIAKVQPTRQHASSFKRLCKYLTTERDADTGEPLSRGDVVLSDNLAGLDTVAIQMEGIAFLNPRCKDALCHYELSWPPGERPTQPQWTDCALHTLPSLRPAEPHTASHGNSPRASEARQEGLGRLAYACRPLSVRPDRGSSAALTHECVVSVFQRYARKISLAGWASSGQVPFLHPPHG